MSISPVKGPGQGQAYSLQDTKHAALRENAASKAAEKRIKESSEPPKPLQKPFIEAFPSKIGTKIDTFA